MREETKRRLERAIWKERAKYAAIGTLVLAAMGLFFLFAARDAEVVNVRIPATVARINPLASKNAAQGVLVDVTLADGRTIEVIALKATDPHVGEKIEITEHQHATGRRTYSWK